MNVFSKAAPLPSLRSGSWSEAPGLRVLVFDPRGTKAGVRRLLPQEVWAAHGGDKTKWRAASEG